MRRDDDHGNGSAAAIAWHTFGLLFVAPTTAAAFHAAWSEPRFSFQPAGFQLAAEGCARSVHKARTQLKSNKDMASHERQVTLHIYTFAGVGGRTNSILSSLSLGLHHSGVEVSGREFSFNDGGVFQTRPHECTRGDEPQCVLKESKFLGVHVGSTNEFNGVLNELRRAFPPGSYSLTGKNCNHFADAFCRALVGCGIPSYVNRAASYGRWLNFGNKGYQIGDGASAEAPKAKPAKADPNRSKKKELTEHQKMLLERIRNGATDKA